MNVLAQLVRPPSGSASPPSDDAGRSRRETHPAPKRGEVRPSLVLAGIVAAPLAWIIQICICEALASHACFPKEHPLSAPEITSLLRLVAAVSAGAFVIGSLGFVAAWTSWRTARKEHTDTGERDATGLSERGRRMHFLALVGVLGSSVFLLGLLLTAMAAFVVSPCARW
jgi:MFS family permease